MSLNCQSRRVQGMSSQAVSKATDAAFTVLMKAEAPGKAVELATGGKNASEAYRDKSVEALKLKAKRIVALAGASLRAKSLAVTEEKALQRLVAQVTNANHPSHGLDHRVTSRGFVIIFPFS